MARKQTPKADAPYPPGWEPFLAAINADLDDDTVRLAFADWLQENGDEPRAEFIRIQCDIARGDSARATEADALLDAHREGWLRGLPPWVGAGPQRYTFRRGFVAALTVLGKQWASTSSLDRNWDAGGKAIRRITALEELRVDQVWNTLVESRTLAGLRSLVLPSSGSGLIESLAKSPVLPSLIGLAILAQSSNGVSQRSFRALFANKKLAQLRQLRVESKPIGNLVAECLAAPHFAGLEELRLRHLSLTATGAESLARSQAAVSLRVLDLLNNQLGDDGLRHLLASPGLRAVTELGLASCNLTPESAHTLADWEGLRTVRKLNLLGNRLRNPEAEVIRASPHAVALTEVNVGPRRT